jgi:DNA-binding PadR family transcriptional regulator
MDIDQENVVDRETIKRVFSKRLITNFLDIIVIAHFSDNPFSGYDVLLFLQNNFDIKFSSGTVYSTLYSMEREGLIQGSDSDNKRTYTITKKGKITAEVATSLENVKNFIAALSGQPFH